MVVNILFGRREVGFELGGGAVLTYFNLMLDMTYLNLGEKG